MRISNCIIPMTLLIRFFQFPETQPIFFRFILVHHTSCEAYTETARIRFIRIYVIF
jgi:hypothetical protein